MDSHTSANPEEKRGRGKSGAKGGAHRDELSVLGNLWPRLSAKVRREIMAVAKRAGR